MKMRAGFVSNSSTSSFVLVGIFLDANQFTTSDLEHRLGNCGWKGKFTIQEESEEDGIFVPSGKIFAGARLLRFHDDGDCSGLLPFAQVTARLAEVYDKLGLSEQEYPAMMVGAILPC